MAFECLLGLSPEDCAVPPKSDLAHVTQLVALNFLASKSTRADFAVDQTGLQLQIEAHAPGVYRLRCAPASVLNNEKPSARARVRSEEHTSELQSLMRISYAVFCLKKKTHNHNQTQSPSFS